MLTEIILLWMLIKLNAPVWCYVLLSICAVLTIAKFGVDLYKIGEGK